MGIRFNSIKNQLLISFLPILGFFFFAMIGGIILLKQAIKVKSFKDQMVIADNSLDLILRQELIFLQSEYNDFDFHETGNNERLLKIEQHYLTLHNTLNDLKTHSWVDKLSDSITLSNYDHKIQIHHNKFNRLVLLVRQRGVKDFGLIGEMRQYIHEVEQDRGILSMTDILFLRRHEKDFLLRNQDIYINKLNEHVDILLNQLKMKGYEAGTTYQNLHAYQTSFNKLVTVIDSIGNFKQNGLKFKFENDISNLELTLESMLDSTDAREQRILNSIYLSFYSVLIFSFIASLFSSYKMAKYRSASIIKFTNAIKRQLDTPLLNKIRPSTIQGASNELRTLIISYNLLVGKLRDQFKVTKKQNKMLSLSNDELVKVNKELDNFVYRVSHDLRAPLSSILGLTKLNKLTDDPKEIKENNTLIETSVHKMDSFISDIINLSRNSRVEIIPEKINFKELIEGIVDHHRYMKNAGSIVVIININHEADYYSDRQRLNVIFSNLIANAFNYSDLRKTKQYLKIGGTIDEKSMDLYVEDNGVGIPQKYLTKIFEMFFRASYYSKGSGLGLYITNETIIKLGGSISVESIEGMLTIFRIQIPNLAKDFEQLQKKEIVEADNCPVENN